MTFGYVQDAHDVTQDPTFGERFGQSIVFPTSHTLRGYVDEVRDQAPTNECVAFALARSLHVHARIHGVQIDWPSTNGIYAYARTTAREQAGLSAAEAPLVDEGCMPTMAVLGMTRHGVASSRLWPFDPSKVNDEPTPLRDGEAYGFRVRGLHRVLSAGAQRIAEVKQAISQGCCVCVGTSVDGAFVDYAGKGLVGPPDPGSLRGKHMVCMLEYDAGSVSGVNSWGPGWGDKGFFGAELEWLTSPEVGDVIAVSAELISGDG